MTNWNISYLDREYAAMMGDPIIGVVQASSKEEAEKIASRLNLGGVYGVWAWKARNVSRTGLELKTR